MQHKTLRLPADPPIGNSTFPELSEVPSEEDLAQPLSTSNAPDPAGAYARVLRVRSAPVCSTLLWSVLPRGRGKTGT